MPAVLGPAVVAASLLAFAGAQKLLDPTLTVGALRALHLPSAPLLVRVGSGVEVAVGVAALAIGGPLLWALVAASYVAFSGVVVAALRSGSPLGTCGCFGREDTPPHALHVVLNVGLAAAAGVAAVGGRAGFDELPPSLLPRLGVIGLLVLAATLLHACYVEVPRLLTAASALRELDLASLDRTLSAPDR